MRDSQMLAEVAHMLRDPQNLWHQGSFHNPINGARCVLGFARSVGKAMGMKQSDAMEQIVPWCERVIRQQYPERYPADDISSVVEFNDSPHTTREEVLAVVEKATLQAEDAEVGI